MTLSLHNFSPEVRPEASDVSIIRREFVELTGDHFSAVILNQLLYWTQRVKDFDLLLEEERQFKPDCNIFPRHGWIYKTADELNIETMLGISHPTMRKYLKQLIDQGWIDERANPVERWNKTTQYRVNLRQIQKDLSLIGRTLPDVYIKAFASSLQECPSSKGLPKPFKKVEETSNVKNLHSNERNFHSDENSEESYLQDSLESAENSNVRNLHSNESCLHSNVKNFDSNVRNLHSYTYTETTSENISKEQKLGASAQENFSDFENLISEHSVSGVSTLHESVSVNSRSATPDLKNSSMRNGASDEAVSDESVPNNSASDESVRDKSPDQPAPAPSVVAEMLGLWKHHVVQHFPIESGKRQQRLNLTESQKDQLESLFAFHFKSDMRLWEQFCLRVKASSFLMGHGARKWTVGLEWILKEGNFSKILSGKYDDLRGSGEQELCEWKLEKLPSTPALNAEKAAILDSIKDPVWKKWCLRLATGVRLNDFKMLHAPLSILQLQQIANAWFLEVEDDRLVWIGSSDQEILDAIENLRLKISWVFAKDYPNATTFRTRLEPHPHHEDSVVEPSYCQENIHE